MATFYDIRRRTIVEYVPPADLRPWRDLVALRQRLVQKRSEPKNSLRALLRREGITPPHTPGMWTKAGRAWLAGVQLRTPEVALERDMLLRETLALDRQVKQLEAEISRVSRENPALLRMVRLSGLGSRTAEVVIASLEEWSRHLS